MKHRENKGEDGQCGAVDCDGDQHVFLCTLPKMTPHVCEFAYAGKLHQVIGRLLRLITPLRNMRA